MNLVRVVHKKSASASELSVHLSYHPYYIAMGLFIEGKGAAALKAYKYSGSDLSLTYKYILSPAAQFCVDNFTPLNVAPNTITLTGLVLMVAAYAVMYMYSPII